MSPDEDSIGHRCKSMFVVVSDYLCSRVFATIKVVRFSSRWKFGPDYHSAGES